jgi:sterol desaturase/sphingolipid hydroxylase (fatty acid hydroxylase superfamily)
MWMSWLQGFAAVVAVAAALSIGAELVVDRWRGIARDAAQVRVNLWLGVPGQVLAYTIVGAVVVAMLSLVPTVGAPLACTPLTIAACFVGVDFLYYWSHRLEHRVRALWGHHSVHHSSHAFDLSTAVRIAWHDGVLAGVYLVPLAALGFPPVLILVCYELLLGYQTWVHTTRVGRLPFVEGLLNTPSAHRVHHAANAYAIDTNYGGVFTIWDRLFGTYAAERPDEPLRYGLTSPVTATHPVAVNFAAYPGLARDLAAAPPAERALALLGPPEWTVREGFARTKTTSMWARLARTFRLRGAPT